MKFVILFVAVFTIGSALIANAMPPPPRGIQIQEFGPIDVMNDFFSFLMRGPVYGGRMRKPGFAAGFKKPGFNNLYDDYYEMDEIFGRPGQVKESESEIIIIRPGRGPGGYEEAVIISGGDKPDCGPKPQRPIQIPAITTERSPILKPPTVAPVITINNPSQKPETTTSVPKVPDSDSEALPLPNLPLDIVKS